MSITATPEQEPASQPADRTLSPLEWVERLSGDLRARASSIQIYDNYYRGIQPLQFSSDKFLSAFGDRFRTFATNFTPLVVDSLEERLQVVGFRVGPDAAADEVAWKIFVDNGLAPVGSQIAHRTALTTAFCYLLVWPDDAGNPVITVESPYLTICAPDPLRPYGSPVAAWKEWQNEVGERFGTLFLPSAVYKFFAAADTLPRFSSPGSKVLGAPGSWEPRQPPGEDWPIVNPTGLVPVVQLVNQPDLAGSGISELSNVTKLQDAINKTTLDMLVAAEYGAMKRRWATGVEIPDDDQGRPLPPFDTRDSRLWAVEDNDVKMGEFTETPLSNYVDAIEMFTKQLATISKTPHHYLSPISGQMPSGESIKSAEAPLIAKAKDRIGVFGAAWANAIKIAFAILGDPRANEHIETLWSDPEYRNDLEQAQAAQYHKQLGLANKTLQQRLGMSPEEIVRNEENLRNEILAIQSIGAEILAGADRAGPPLP